MNKLEIQYKTILKTAVITIVVMAVLLYAPSPFVVVKPGVAVSSNSFVTVIDKAVYPNWDQTDQSIGSDTEREGTFLLTAVLMDAPNIWDSLRSIFQSNRTVMWKYEVLGGDTVEQYAKRATTMMQGSYDHALEAAYRYLNIAYHNESQQLFVNTESASVKPKSGDQLLSGDRINGIYSNESITPVTSVEDITEWMKEHEEATIIELQVERVSELIHLTIDLVGDKSQVLNDANIATLLSVDGFKQVHNIIPEEDKYKVAFEDSSIGGPSAGLVLTLTIIDLLTDGDLTKGHKIAVTGTIDAQGHVGAIGGIKQKVYSTDEQGAEIFIVPQGNEADATKKVHKLGSEMEIIAVSTLEEAMEVIASINN
ncbi:S16 family serine protease [Paenibacillus endoradicis]|uniref:S16 family serine protease n=1 Tax=Paenibacillus endoradicis TaxID=2972487 RepID=UPI002158D9FA|nr:S16 family serine protease [Paenibacillus endoradicis]MCR8656186.1 hypothetical protein [Paenibacillus endoradicis]